LASVLSCVDDCTRQGGKPRGFVLFGSDTDISKAVRATRIFPARANAS